MGYGKLVGFWPYEIREPLGYASIPLGIFPANRRGVYLRPRVTYFPKVIERYAWARRNDSAGPDPDLF